MNELLTAILWLSGIGLFCGLALSLAARFFSVHVDPRIEKIHAALPGANCGGCGFPGCEGYATAIVAGKAPPNRCNPGGPDVRNAIAAIMGLEKTTEKHVPMVAFVKCGGDNAAAKRRFLYDGLTDCAAATAIAGGDKSCTYGCLGYGSCARVCTSNAIHVTEGGIARVDPDKCIGCGLCVEACPRHVIELVPKASTVRVQCNSPDPGAVVRKNCKTGCIGCRLCAKSAGEAIQINGFLARVNYDIPFPECDAVAKCPAKCLRRYDVQPPSPASK